MSISRYTADDYMVTAPDGEFVLFKDYAALEARCAGLERDYDLICSDRDRLAVVVKGMDDQSFREAEKLLKEQMENEKLRQEAANWHSAMLADRDALVRETKNAISDRDAIARECKSVAAERDAAVARAETLENGILSAMDYWNRCEEPGAMSDALYEIENRLNAAIAGHAPEAPMLDHLTAVPQPITVQAAPSDRERRLEEALRHTCKHLCQWKDACEVGCPVSAALADTTTGEVQP